MSSVSGTNGELSHLTPSLFKEFTESFVKFVWVLEGIDETGEIVEKG